MNHTDKVHRTIACPDCEKRFVLAVDRDRHRRDAHTHPRYNCDVSKCKFYAPNMDELHIHKRNAHWDTFKFRCGTRPCYHVFRSLDKLKDHLAKVHNIGIVTDPTSDATYNCDKCQRTFKSINMLCSSFQ